MPVNRSQSWATLYPETVRALVLPHSLMICCSWVLGCGAQLQGSFAHPCLNPPFKCALHLSDAASFQGVPLEPCRDLLHSPRLHLARQVPAVAALLPAASHLPRPLQWRYEASSAKQQTGAHLL